MPTAILEFAALMTYVQLAPPTRNATFKSIAKITHSVQQRPARLMRIVAQLFALTAAATLATKMPQKVTKDTALSPRTTTEKPTQLLAKAAESASTAMKTQMTGLAAAPFLESSLQLLLVLPYCSSLSNACATKEKEIH